MFDIADVKTYCRIIPGTYQHPGKREVPLNRCEMLWVCNVFAKTFRVTP